MIKPLSKSQNLKFEFIDLTQSLNTKPGSVILNYSQLVHVNSSSLLTKASFCIAVTSTEKNPNSSTTFPVML